uniref:C-type lectin domain-containing protein n=1 Tax=Rhabditophanes sp. KR3021 TaxID=114890 RepID=A0AC35U720_9BILA
MTCINILLGLLLAKAAFAVSIHQPSPTLRATTTWISGPTNNKYQFHNGWQSWLNAREFCLSQNADLASINNNAELQWILKHFSNDITTIEERIVQIGLFHSSDNESKWKWADKDSLDTSILKWKNEVPFNSSKKCSVLLVNERKIETVECDSSIILPDKPTRFICERSNEEHIEHEKANNPLWEKFEQILSFLGISNEPTVEIKKASGTKTFYDDLSYDSREETNATRNILEKTTDLIKVELKEDLSSNKVSKKQEINILTSDDIEGSGEGSGVNVEEVKPTVETTSIKLANATKELTMEKKIDNLKVSVNNQEQKKITEDDKIVNKANVNNKLPEPFDVNDKKANLVIDKLLPLTNSEIIVTETLRGEEDALIVATSDTTVAGDLRSNKSVYTTLDPVQQKSNEKISLAEKIVSSKEGRLVTENIKVVQITTIPPNSTLKVQVENNKNETVVENEEKIENLEEKITDFFKVLKKYLQTAQVKDLRSILDTKKPGVSITDHLKASLSVINQREVKQIAALEKLYTMGVNLQKVRQDALEKATDHNNAKQVIKDIEDELTNDLAKNLSAEFDHENGITSQEENGIKLKKVTTTEVEKEVVKEDELNVVSAKNEETNLLVNNNKTKIDQTIQKIKTITKEFVEKQKKDKKKTTVVENKIKNNNPNSLITFEGWNHKPTAEQERQFAELQKIRIKLDQDAYKVFENFGNTERTKKMMERIKQHELKKKKKSPKQSKPPMKKLREIPEAVEIEETDTLNSVDSLNQLEYANFYKNVEFVLIPYSLTRFGKVMTQPNSHLMFTEDDMESLHEINDIQGSSSSAIDVNNDAGSKNNYMPENDDESYDCFNDTENSIFDKPLPDHIRDIVNQHSDGDSVVMLNEIIQDSTSILNGVCLPDRQLSILHEDEEYESSDSEQETDVEIDKKILTPNNSTSSLPSTTPINISHDDTDPPMASYREMINGNFFNFNLTDGYGQSPSETLEKYYSKASGSTFKHQTPLFDNDPVDHEDEITIKEELEFGQIEQENGEIMNLIAKVFIDNDQYQSAYGIYINHSNGAPEYKFLVLTNKCIYIVSQYSRDAAEATEALPGSSSSNNAINFMANDDLLEEVIYTTHLIIPLKNINLINVTYDYQMLSFETDTLPFKIPKTNDGVKKFNVETANQFLGQKLLSDIKSILDESGIKKPEILIDNCIRNFFYAKFIEGECKLDTNVKIRHHSMIYWRQIAIVTKQSKDFQNLTANVIYRLKNSISWFSKSYTDWKDVFCELTVNQLFVFADSRGKQALFNFYIMEEFNDVNEATLEDSAMYGIEISFSNDKPTLQLAFKTHHEMSIWLNMMKELHFSASHKTLPEPTLCFFTDDMIYISTEMHDFLARGMMREFCKIPLSSILKVMYFHYENNNVIIIWRTNELFDCIFTRYFNEMERIIRAMNELYQITATDFQSFKNTDGGSYEFINQSLKVWANVWRENFTE